MQEAYRQPLSVLSQLLLPNRVTENLLTAWMPKLPLAQFRDIGGLEFRSVVARPLVICSGVTDIVQGIPKARFRDAIYGVANAEAVGYFGVSREIGSRGFESDHCLDHGAAD